MKSLPSPGNGSGHGRGIEIRVVFFIEHPAQSARPTFLSVCANTRPHPVGAVKKIFGDRPVLVAEKPDAITSSEGDHVRRILKRLRDAQVESAIGAA
jgi:hypothetical protein